MARSARLVLTALAASLAVASLASAQIDVRALSRAAKARGAAPSVLAGTTSVVVELPPGAATPPGLVPIAPGFAAFHGSFDTAAALAHAHPGWRVSWAPPRRPLIDMAAQTTHAAQFRNLTGLTGQNVVVGIVDTGFDARHADLRDAFGKTRVAWTLDFSRTAAGLHPGLEAEYGCTGNEDYTCAILSGTDIDQLIALSNGNVPRDTLGHGTHVASLAAGNGLSTTPPKFVGIAPGATIIAARVTRGGSGSIQDPDVLAATRFIFDRAEELGLPAIVNLSLGSDFGGHDGNAPLERALASFVGPAFPGRAIVVAAGNSGGVYSALSSAYPGPFGIYTEVHVPRASSVRVPLLTPVLGPPTTNATIYVWVAGRPGDKLEVGVDDADGEWVEPLPPGEGATYERDGLEATVINQSFEEGSPIAPGSNGAVVVLDGRFRSGSTFAIRLEGFGTARLWVQSEGDLLPGGSNPGALFPRATKHGTIGIPASSPALLSIGATINRLGWSHRGTLIKVGSFGADEEPKADSTAYFSGAGPNANGQMKPDLVAPGVFVIGAMSSLADPDENGGSGVFAGGGLCAAADLGNCLVVDDFHGVTSGTSMAAPIVTGAIALLFERDPTLRQDEIRTLLQAGAQSLEGVVHVEQQVGPGELDLVGTLAVMDAKKTPIDALPSRDQSWLALADSYAHPDLEWPLEGVVELRAEDESIADGFDVARFTLEVEGASVRTPLTRVAPGMWKFSVVAPPGSGGRTLRLELAFDGAPLIERVVPIAVDRWVADGGADARGGCGVTAGAPAGTGLVLALFSIVLGLRRNRWRRAR